MTVDLSNAEIAERLVMTPGTVKWYVKEIYSKLDVHSRDEAIARASQLNVALQSQSVLPTPTNLPAPTTSLVGREREIAAVCQRLLRTDVRLLTLVGSPGIGKTRLSLASASTLLSEFSNGVYFVPLAPVSDPALVANAIAQSLDVQDMGGQSISEILKHYLREKVLLLVLDNFEHLLSAAPLVAELLAAASRLKVLATSREALRVYGEQEYPVPPLALPDPKVSDGVETLREYEAVALFVKRAKAVKPDFDLTPDNALAIVAICARLDGLPLAIELAAARMKLYTPNALFGRLHQCLSALTGGARDLPERQQTLRGAIAWSYDLLNEGEKILFARFGVFVGGWSLEAIEAVCSANLSMDVYDGLESLLNKSLVQQTEGANGKPRFMTLETLREYALEKLAESGEEQAVRQAHAEYFLALAEQAEPELYRADQQRWLNRLEEEYNNLREGLEWFYHNNVESAACFAVSLTNFWWIKGNIRERAFWLETLVKECDVLSLASKARILREAGKVARDLGNLSLAHIRLHESLGLCKQLEDGRGIGLTLGHLGWLADLQYDVHAARSFLEESIVILQEHGNKNVLATAIHELATVARHEGEYEQARMLYEKGLMLRRESCDVRGIANSLGSLGLLSLDLGEWSRAEPLLQESLAILRQLGAKFYVALTLFHLGRVLRHQHEGLKQAVLVEESITLFREMDIKPNLASTIVILADAKIKLGEYRSARLLLEESLSLYQGLEDAFGFAEVVAGYAHLAAAQMQWQRAACLFAVVDTYQGHVSFYWTPSEQALFQRAIAVVRTQLDESSFAAAWEEGVQMTLDQAVTYALEQVEV